MNERVGLSKKARFDVFKRDAFVCQYCGRTPPSVVLEVDHVTAVSRGGTNDDHNLLTSCFDCNRGKSDGTLDASPIDVRHKAEILAERMDQARAYDDLLIERRRHQDGKVEQIVVIYETAFTDWTLPDKTRISIRNFLEKLPFMEVVDAMEKACTRTNKDRAFKYFCGVCWNKIRDSGG